MNADAANLAHALGDVIGHREKFGRRAHRATGGSRESRGAP
jgi:hypothetical protein